MLTEYLHALRRTDSSRLPGNPLCAGAMTLFTLDYHRPVWEDGVSRSQYFRAIPEWKTVQLDPAAIPVPPPLGLARADGKRQLYSVDTYFRDSWEDLSGVAGKGAVAVASTHALLLLKPDAVVRRRLSAALDWLTTRGWRITHAQRFRVNRWAIRAFWQYQWNTATRDRREMADLYMSATDSLVLVLRAPDAGEWATAALTRVKGSSDPARCRPGQLRSVLGTLNQQLNLVHSADEPADLVREIGICCTPAERAVVYRAMAAGADAEVLARRLASTLEAEYPPLDLTLSGTVSRLQGRLGGGNEHDRLHRCLAAVRDGDETGWRDVVGLAERAGVTLTRWDRVVLGTYLLDPTLPGVVPLVPDASAAATAP